MDKEYIEKYNERISKLSEEQKNQHDLYLKKLQDGRLYGPTTDVTSINRPWLKFYSDSKILSQMPKMNMFEYLCECNKNSLDSIALNFFGAKVTYKELIENIKKAKKGFQKMGVKNGDYVTIGMPFLPETIYAFYALNDLGAIANICDPRVPGDKFKNYINGTKSKYVIAIDSICEKIDTIIGDTNVSNVIYVKPTNSVSLIKKILSKKSKVNIPKKKCYVSWNDFIKNGKNVDDNVFVEYEQNKPAAVVYTSGTTGETKGAVLSNDALNIMSFSQTEAIMNTEPGDKFLLIMPPFIAYGFAIGMHGQLCTSQQLVMIPNFNIEMSKEMIGSIFKKYKPQTVMGVPTFVNDLINSPKLQNMDLSFFKRFIVGGDTVSEKTEIEGNNFFRNHNSNAKVQKGWGLTEASSCASFTKNDDTNQLKSVGIPLIKNNIKIVKLNQQTTDIDELEEAKVNEQGEIYIQTPTQMNGYLDNKKLEKEVLISSKSGDWIRTMDIGSIDENGNIQISGRLKRIIVRPDGHNIAPFAIENIINSIPYVQSCAVVGRPSEGFNEGHWGVAYIELKPEYNNDLYKQMVVETIIKLQQEKLPPRDIAEYFEFIDKMPLTDIGKIDYKSLQDKEDNIVTNYKSK